MAPVNATPKIQLERLLYTHYQHQNLAAANKFFTDFGFIPVQQSDDIVYYRGFGDSPYIYVAERSPDKSKHFVGGGWVVKSQTDLEAASRLPGASQIQESTAPGGGQYVDVQDLNGINVRLIYGITYRGREKLEQELPKAVVFNSWEDKQRKGEFQRFDAGPSKVHKLGHYGLVVDKSNFDSTVAWYTQTFGLAPTDSLFDEESGKDTMTFMHIDKGEEFTDHHPRFDASGNIVEHYSDGDLVNKNSVVTREKAAPDTMAVWGPNVSFAFLTGRIEDISKGPAVPEVKKVPDFMLQK
ncbi:hypothetical protein ACEPPN_011086 [Leptodophora sp. 'Broadleaf-Isolate-01']